MPRCAIPALTPQDQGDTVFTQGSGCPTGDLLLQTFMRKSFALHHPAKADARVRDAIRHEVRKYVVRERRKPLPADADLRIFNCRVGPDESSAVPQELPAVASAIDAVAATGASSVFIEIISQAARRPSSRWA